MKSKFTITVVFALFYFNPSAQITNGGFESWSSNDPTSWVSTNGLMFFGNPQTIFKSNDAHSGSFACEMVAAKITTKPSGIFVPDYGGSIFLGKQTFTSSQWGMKYTYRPTHVEYWFKYKPVGTDTANGLFILTRWDSVQAKRDTIATAFTFHHNTDTIYTKASVAFTYYSSATPDTAIIGVASVALSCDHAGSKFLLDDLNFTGGNVGVSVIEASAYFDIYPNPSHEILNIKFNKNYSKVSLSLYNLLGKEVVLDVYKNIQETNIQTSQLEAGLYLLKVSNEDGEFTRKFWVQ
ncbi:MAG: T9SS type A sorting domain-containing protein [Bacteroidota bacterium]|nr:T9SS type A sorting domain-containing protein [Bacteroidota bacterium]